MLVVYINVSDEVKVSECLRLNQKVSATRYYGVVE